MHDGERWCGVGGEKRGRDRRDKARAGGRARQKAAKDGVEVLDVTSKPPESQCQGLDEIMQETGRP